MSRNILISSCVFIFIICAISLVALNKSVKLDNFEDNQLENAEWKFAQYEIDDKTLSILSTAVTPPHSGRLQLSGTIYIEHDQNTAVTNVPDVPLTIDLYGGSEFDLPENDINFSYREVRNGIIFDKTLELDSKTTNVQLRIFHYFPSHNVSGTFKLHAKPNIWQVIIIHQKPFTLFISFVIVCLLLIFIFQKYKLKLAYLLISIIILLTIFVIIVFNPLRYSVNNSNFNEWSWPVDTSKTNGFFIKPRASNYPYVASKLISLPTNQWYKMEVNYNWQGQPAVGKQFLFDLYIPGKWDRNEFNFIPTHSACRSGKHSFRKFFFLNAPQTSMYVRVINASKANIHIENFKITASSELQSKISQYKLFLLSSSTVQFIFLLLVYLLLLYSVYKLYSVMNKRIPLLLSKIIFVLSLSIILLNFIYNLYFVKSYGVNIPYLDDWYFIEFTDKLYNGIIDFKELFRQVGPHRPFTLRMFISIIGVLTRYNLKIVMYVTQFFYALILFVLFAAFKSQYSKQTAGNILLAFVPVALLLFHIRQFEIMLWSLCIGIVLTNFFALTSLYSLSKVEVKVKYYIIFFCVAIICAFFATYSYIYGILVWPLGLFILLLSEFSLRKKISCSAIWITAGTIIIMSFAYSWQAQQLNSSSSIFDKPLIALRYFTTLVGGSLFWELSDAFIVGCIVLPIAFIVFVISLSKKCVRNRNLFWITSMIFSIGILLMVTMGRFSRSMHFVVTSRYSMYSLLLLISTYAITVNVYFHTKRIIYKIFLGVIVTIILYSLYISFSKDEYFGKIFCNDLQKRVFEIQNREYELNNVFISRRLGTSVRVFFRALKIFEKNKWNLYSYKEGTFPPLTDYPALDSLTQTNIAIVDYSLKVNDTSINNKNKKVHLKNSNKITISGYAIDLKTTNVFRGVYIKLDNNIYKAFYGAYTPHIRDAYESTKVGFAKYYLRLPTKHIHNGKHELVLYLIDKHNDYYYSITHTIHITQ